MNRLLLGFAALALGLVTAIGGASAQDRVKAGTLMCDVSGGIGMIIGSQKGVRCEFTPDLAGPREYYIGTISKFGLDIGATSAGQMIWAVFAPSTRTPGVLAGTYTGATAEATAIVGIGANALIGGSNRTVALQPLSITGQTGLNLAGGVASLELRSTN
jgi:Protein of unknown function (DUF992)